MDTSGPSPTIQIDVTTVMSKPTTISTLENRASKEEAISVEVKERAWLIFQLIAGLIMERYKKARLLGVGLMIPARHQDASTALVVASQMIASASGKDIATVIDVSQILVSFGSAVGNAVAGGIWTQHLPSRLRERVTGPYDRDCTMNDPLNYVKNLDPFNKQQVMAPTATRKSL
ncbi:hypothetical protein BGZ52_000788 [Haplosporangium bisporale]|nr:hypothetical protein BGZ52_000788 [Haplosporangium bisporale]